MAASHYPTTQALAGSFIISAGCILFRMRDNNTPTSHSDKESNVHINAVDENQIPLTPHSTAGSNNDTTIDTPSILAPTARLQVCILHHLKRDEWLLPKGRKDRGESIEVAAVRETYEETGYKCSLWALRMPTRAPAVGSVGDQMHKVQVVDGLTEPIGMTVRELHGTLGVKTIFWFIGLADNGGEVKDEGTQMPNESFESVFFDADEAVERLTFLNDRDVVRLAVEIVRDNLERGLGDSNL